MVSSFIEEPGTEEICEPSLAAKQALWLQDSAAQALRLPGPASPQTAFPLPDLTGRSLPEAKLPDCLLPELPELPGLPDLQPWAAEQPLFPSDPRARILALYDEFRPRLFRYLGSLHLSRESADEVIQETFMRLTTALLGVNEIKNVQGWIVRVAHNLAIDLLKRERGPVVALETGSFVIENRADPALSPEDAYVRKEQSRQMKIALSSLKPQHRKCFEMRAQGFRYKDIGVALGISEQRAAFVVKQAAVHLAALCE
jgi:RNA polymerase sigma-70 factor (ECF subfamily)